MGLFLSRIKHEKYMGVTVPNRLKFKLRIDLLPNLYCVLIEVSSAAVVAGSGVKSRNSRFAVTILCAVWYA